METHSLFAQQKPKRGRVVLMLAGSLVFHGGLVGIATMFTPPQPEDHTVIIWDGPVEGGNPSPIPAPTEPTVANVDNSPTPTPETIKEPIVDATPPPVSNEPDFAQPASPTPRQVSTVHPRTITARTLHPVTGPASTNPSSSVVGTGPGTGASTAGTAWSMPHPPYPAALRSRQVTGSTTVRITTDASGAISNVVILRSTGNALLDAQTVSYVRSNWYGPANASRTTEFVYKMR